MGIQLALLLVGIILHKGIGDLATSSEDSILPRVVVLLILSLGNLQALRQFSVHKDRLHQRSHGGCENLSGIHDHTATTVGIRTGSTDGKTGIEAAAGSIHIIETACQVHLSSMHIGTVLQQLDAYTCCKLRRQHLIGEFSALDGLGRLAYQQREGVLHFTNLTLHIFYLCQHAVVTGLSTLHTGRTITAQLHLQFHHVPGILGKTRHVIQYLQLTVEHQQRIVHIGDTTHNLGLHHHLIVLGSQQCHLGTTFLVEQIAKEIHGPRGIQRHGISLRSLTEIP